MKVLQAGVLALAVGGLLALDAAPAHASFTGCLNLGGIITQVAPGDKPRRGRCPHGQLQIHLGGGSGSGGISGVETVEETFTGLRPAAGKQVEAKCPAGKRVIGGGALASVGQTYVNGTYPNDANDGWVGFFVNREGIGGLDELTVYAICATVPGFPPNS